MTTGSVRSAGVRLRSDLRVVRRRRLRTDEAWLADPVSGRVVRTSWFNFLRLADRQQLAELAQASQQESAAGGSAGSATLALEETRRHGLLAEDRHAPSSSRDSSSRDAASAVAKRWWANPLYIRLPGLPADRLAVQLARYTGFLFSLPAVLSWCLLILVSGGAALVSLESLTREVGLLPAFQASHWGIAISVIGFTKIAHELSHAAVCRRLGAPCREIGMLLLCGTPCLYCDVSESWRVPVAGRRMAIMAAGIYCEWIIAALAFWVWFFSEPSLLHLTALHLMFVCGISTFIFNANPLMRYDGYFVLADLLNQTNMRQRAKRAFDRLLIASWAKPRATGWSGGQWFGGKWRVADWLGADWWGECGWAGYFVASRVYQWFVVVALVGWFYMIASNMGMEPVARVVVWLLALMVVVMQGMKLGNMFRGGGFWQTVPAWRRGVVAAAIVVLLIAGLFIPVQRRVTISGTVQLAGAQTVYVPETATVERIYVQPGQQVERGQLLASLRAPSFELEQLRSEARAGELAIQYAALRQRSVAEPELIDRLAPFAVAVAAADELVQERAQRTASLQLRAPDAGMVFSPPAKPPAESSPIPRVDHDFSPLVGATIEASEPWCHISDPRAKQVTLSVDAKLRRHFASGQAVRVSLDAVGRVVETTVGAISSTSVERGSASAEGVLSQHVSPDSFQITCGLPAEIAGETPLGGKVTAVVRGESIRLWDYLWDTIRGDGL
ncbi:hypothetical protein SH139x_003779 [Planctomycetaceae bacterium SH139]